MKTIFLRSFLALTPWMAFHSSPAAELQVEEKSATQDAVLLQREAKEINLDLGDGTGETYSIDASPVLTASGVLTLVPGEQFALRFKSQRDGLLTQPEIEKDASKANDCIPIKLSYEDGRALLIVGNPYAQELSYSLASIKAGSDELTSHQANPVPSRQGNLEAFAEKVIFVILKDFKLSPSTQK